LFAPFGERGEELLIAEIGFLLELSWWHGIRRQPVATL
jgi:hypothetical protein